MAENVALGLALLGLGKSGSGSSAMLVGTVASGGSFPTTRPNGDPLQNGDYVRPTGTFPFTVSGITFTSVRDKAKRVGTNWVLEAGANQTTAQTPVSDASTESISGASTTQAAINVENKAAINSKVNNVKVNGTSVVSSGVAELIADGVYSSSNPIALKNSIPEVPVKGVKVDGASVVDGSGIAQVNLTNKQDKLTAGTNITITGNVISATGGGKEYTAGANVQITSEGIISATDTTYSAGAGISISPTHEISATGITIPEYLKSASVNSEALTILDKNDNPTTFSIAGKQNTINDLASIRAGAVLGTTAVQPAAISDMATKTWVNSEGYLKSNHVNHETWTFTTSEGTFTAEVCLWQ